MIARSCRNAWFLVLGICLCWPAASAQAQKPPTDLTELNIEEILSLRINRQTLQRWSVGYRFVYATFDGYRDGTNDLDLHTEVLGPPNGVTYPVTPTEITQQAHLVDLSYNTSEKLSFGLLLPFIRQSSDHESLIGDRGGHNFHFFNITSSGLGDISLSASYLAWKKDDSHLVANFGIKLPTGSIEEKGLTPRDPPNDTLLPFTMQLGSGTLDLEPSLAYGNKSGRWRYGAKTYATVRMGNNSRDYSLGDRFGLSGSLRAMHFTWLEPFLQLGFQTSGAIDGVDEDLKVPSPSGDGTLVFPAPVTNPALFGGQELTLTLGSKITQPEGMLKSMSLRVGYDIPIYQSLNGPQPKELGRLDLSWAWTF